jgi:hypothetical protein
MKRYIIKSESGVHNGTCNQGDGITEKAAWECALGPKPWSDWQKKCAKKYWCVAEEMEEGEPVSYSGH